MEWAWNWAIRLESERKSWRYQHRDHVQSHESLWSYRKECLGREAWRKPAWRPEEDKEKREKQGFAEKKNPRCSKYREPSRTWVGTRQPPEIQCFSAFLVRRTFNAVPHAAVTANHKVSFAATSLLWFCCCNESQCKYLIWGISAKWSPWKGHLICKGMVTPRLRNADSYHSGGWGKKPLEPRFAWTTVWDCLPKMKGCGKNKLYSFMNIHINLT